MQWVLSLLSGDQAGNLSLKKRSRPFFLIYVATNISCICALTPITQPVSVEQLFFHQANIPPFSWTVFSNPRVRSRRTAGMLRWALRHMATIGCCASSCREAKRFFNSWIGTFSAPRMWLRRHSAPLRTSTILGGLSPERRALSSITLISGTRPTGNHQKLFFN